MFRESRLREKHRGVLGDRDSLAGPAEQRSPGTTQSRRLGLLSLCASRELRSHDLPSSPDCVPWSLWTVSLWGWSHARRGGASSGSASGWKSQRGAPRSGQGELGLQRCSQRGRLTGSCQGLSLTPREAGCANTQIHKVPAEEGTPLAFQPAVSRWPVKALGFEKKEML